GSASVSYEPDLMSRTATRGGPRMAQPGSVALSLGLGTDNRKLLSLSPKVGITRGRDGSGDAVQASLGVTLQPSTRLLVTLEPSYRNTTDGAQFVTATSALPYAPTYGTRYLFADLDRTDLSMVTRVNMTFTPRLSLEMFAQPFVSTGDFVTYKQLAAPERYDFDVFQEGSVSRAGCAGGRTCEDGSNQRFVDFDGDGTADLTFTDRDFNVRSLRSTAVLRWEYRPGSTVFFVWQHRQAGQSTQGDFDPGRDLGALFDAPSDDVFIVKANVWLSW
ncbi:MAG TPA: hypothetical protein VJ997_09365, partial [Longimicrobiales bacterium]|nr:hypothetical protein [Longimicrobiales bacterium]